MFISEFIKQLEEYKAKHGDLPMTCSVKDSPYCHCSLETYNSPHFYLELDYVIIDKKLPITPFNASNYIQKLNICGY